MSDQKSLKEKYPELFPADVDSRTPVSLFGIECGAGWYKLLDELCADIIRLANEEGIPVPTVQQIKEKFGTLRFYMDVETDAMYERISEAELESSKTCERCGEPGSRTVVGGWHSTLCGEHLADLQKKRPE